MYERCLINSPFTECFNIFLIKILLVGLMQYIFWHLLLNIYYLKYTNCNCSFKIFCVKLSVPLYVKFVSFKVGHLFTLSVINNTLCSCTFVSTSNAFLSFCLFSRFGIRGEWDQTPPQTDKNLIRKIIES